MSNSGSFEGRKSWRRSESSATGRRTTARVVTTILAVGLIALFAFMIWRGRPSRRTNVLLVSADTFDLEVMMPLMYGGNARQQLRQTLEADLLNGQVDVIRRRFQEHEALRSQLQDADDTFILFVRGYLLAGPDGRPGIACSDLAVGADAVPSRGLLPLQELLHPLATIGPVKGPCQRLVVLDLEPLAADPRLGQLGDRVFESLQQTVVELGDQPLGDRVWLLLTRGPLENVGWDHQADLPISTQTFLEAIAGAADFNRDHEIRLSELCDYMAARYRGLAGDFQDPPRLVLLRGGSGRVSSTAEADHVWLARSGDFSWGPPPGPEEQNPAESDASKPDEVAQGSQDATSPTPLGDAETGQQHAGRSSMPIRRVHLAAPDEGSQAAPGNNSSPSAPSRSGTGDATPELSIEAAGQTGQRGESEVATDSSKSATDQAASQPAAAGTALEDFWDIRDRLESTTAADQLGPVGLSPHVWRLLVRQLLYSEIESLDGQSEARALRARRAIDGIRALERAARSGISIEPAGSGLPSSGVAEVDAVAAAWQQWRSRRSTAVVDDQVRVADSLQQAVAIARSRVGNWLDFQQQAMVSGGSGLGDDSDLRERMERGEALLHEQQGSTASVEAMVESRDRIIEAVDRFDRSVTGELEELFRSLDRRDPKRGWGLIRQADAWVRSPLPSGPQRRRLREAIRRAAADDLAASKLAVQAERSGRPDRPAAADLARLRQEGALADAVNQWAQVYRETRAADGVGLMAVDEASASIARGEPLWSADPDPVRQLAAALRVDPRDTAMGLSRGDPDRPILHRVTARPRIPQPSIQITDQRGDQIRAIELAARAEPRAVILRLRPDSDLPTSLTVTVKLNDPRLTARWSEPVAQRQPVERPRGVSIGPLEDRELTLEVSATGDGGTDGLEGHIEFQIEMESGTPLVGLAGIHRIPVSLPRRDQIRLVVGPQDNVGFSEPVVSGRGDLPDGLWMRTFASRTTPFQLSLFNDSGRAARARVWLLRLDDPYAVQGVRAYWPGLQRRELATLGRQLRDIDGRVTPRFLSTALKGPVEIDLPAGKTPIPLRWTAPATGADEPGAAAGDRPRADSGSNSADSGSGSADSEGSAGTDVSHGMALVVRLIDAAGAPLREDDQLIWMLPKPWDPENYLDLPLVRYRDGQIQIRAALKSRIDGDAVPDQIPEIGERPVLVRWIEDDQWMRYEPGSRGDRRFRLLELDGAQSSTMELPVPPRSRTFVRLEVDGWPRALHREVEHREGAEGRPYTQRNTIEFLSVAMQHGDPPPSLREQDDPIAPGEVWFPSQVIFRGGGQRIHTQISADFSSRLLEGFGGQRDDPPELRVTVNDAGARRYWTDRLVRTVATLIDDHGQIRLLTTVEDPPLVWTTEARREDTTLRFGAELLTDNVRRNGAALAVTLDSTPPVVEPPVHLGGSMFEVGQEIRWEYRCVDMAPGGRPGSGIARVHFRVDVDGDRVPDDKHLPDRITPPRTTVSASEQGLTRSFVPENPGLHHLIIQAWDAAGLASEPAILPFVVRPKPVEKPADGEMAGKPKIGNLRGRIATGSTMRGTISIKPLPPGIQPASGTVQAGGSGPAFAFRNLPEQKYTITFRGTVNNVLQTLEWADLLIDVADGGVPSLSLSIDQAEQK